MCNYPWSNRDSFDFVTDCHINEPVFITLNVIVFFLSLICVGFALHQLIIQIRLEERKEITCSTLLTGIFLSITYGIILGKKITFVDRNLGLNIIHGLGRAMTWINGNLSSARHLQFLTITDKRLETKSSTIYPLLLHLNMIVNSIIIISELLAAIIPTLILTIDFYTFVGSISMILPFLSALPQAIYAYKLREIIITAKKCSQDLIFYTPIQQKLDRIIRAVIFAIAINQVIMYCMFWIPTIRSNLYIPYTIQMMFCPTTGMFNVIGARPSQEHSTLSTRKEQEQSTQLDDSCHSQQLQTSHLPPRASETTAFIENPSPPQSSIREERTNNTEHSPMVVVDTENTTTPKIWNPFLFSNPMISSTVVDADSSFSMKSIGESGEIEFSNRSLT